MACRRFTSSAARDPLCRAISIPNGLWAGNLTLRGGGSVFSGSVTGNCLHTLGGCDGTSWRGLSSPRLLCLMHALAKLQELQELAFEINLHFNENLEPHVGERQA